jgi:hypothetical protein
VKPDESVPRETQGGRPKIAATPENPTQPISKIGHYNGEIYDQEWISLPETMVAAGPPLKERPSKGELRDLLAESLTL